MLFDLTAFARVVARLGEGGARHRAGAAVPAEIDRMTFPTLIRTGVEQGLVGSD